MTVTRSSSKGKSLVEGSLPASSKKRLRLPDDNDLGQGRPEVKDPTFRPSPKYGWKLVTNIAEAYKRVAEISRAPPPGQTILTSEQIAKCALSDYNEKHGTDFEFVSISDDRIHKFCFPGYCIDFVDRHVFWTHFNFEARRQKADPRAKPLLLFAETQLTREGNHCITVLSPVKPTDKANGCQRCWSNISHPRHGFRADASLATYRRSLSLKDASKFSKLALELYNNQNGTKLKFIRAMQCNRFTCVGLLMDFTRKKTSWVHMNFEARVLEEDEEDIIRLFGELYLGDDGNYVLATLSATEPIEIPRRERMKLDIQCPCCPDDIHHPWRGFRSGFNYRPCRDISFPTSTKGAA